MEEFFSRLAELWAKNRIVAWILVLSATGLALWTTYSPQSPGVSIGLLALVAGIMSLRPEMHILEKIAWIVLLICFTVLEIHAIGVSDKKNEDVRDKQNKEFDAIVKKLTDSDKLSRDQFNATMNGVNKVFDKTKQTADTATAAVNTITGGNTFCYLQFLGFREPQWIIKGKHPLHDVNVLIRDQRELMNAVIKSFSQRGDLPNNDELTMARVPIKLGDLAPNHNESVSPLPPILQSLKERILVVNFTAVNGEWTEIDCMATDHTVVPSAFVSGFAETILIERNDKIFFKLVNGNYPKDQPCTK